MLRDVDSAAPFGKVNHCCVCACTGFFGTQPGVEHRLFNRTKTPTRHVVINLGFRFPYRLAQALQIFILEAAQRRMIILHKGKRLSLGAQNHRTVIVKGIIQVKGERRDAPQRPVKTHYFPRLARGCAASYTEARC
ncbi:Uncharacterised protein [Shigella sonnei]|nr:Uncharacterised protein [Shigella sonnei]